MSTERPALTARVGLRTVLLVLAALAATHPALLAQQPDTDPQPPTGVQEAPTAPDPSQLPGEPPTVDDAEPGLDDVEDTTEYGSFLLTSFSVGSAYDRLSDDDAAADSDQELDQLGTSEDGEIAYLLVPSFLFMHRPDARGRVVLAYEPEIESFQDDDGEERVSHSAGLLWERRATRRTDLTAGASYLDSLDPTRHLGGEGFVLIPGRFEQERAFFGASHLWPRATRLHFYTEYASARSDLGAEADPIDVTDLSGTVALEQGIGRDSDVTFSYSYTDTELETVDSDAAAPERFSGPIDALRVGFGHRFGKGMSLHLSAGALRERAIDSETVDPSQTDDDVSWIGAAEIARESGTLSMRLRYDRSLFAFGYGDAGVPSGVEGPLVDGAALRDTVADTLAFFLAVEPHHRVRFEQSLWLARETLVEGDDLNSFVTGSLVEVLLTGQRVHRLLLYSRLDYFDRDDSDLLGEALSRTRFSLGFRVGLTGPQTKVGQRVAATELRRVLPTAGRL
jgi:hypothetical protein